MPRHATVVVLALLFAGSASPALAQHIPFERTFDVTGVVVLDASTIRGKIEVRPGPAGRAVVAGAATVRVGWDVPANAVELARRVADHPPITREGQTIRLRPPSDSDEQRAVTVSYQVTVPADTQVIAVSDSGATDVTGLTGDVEVRTQSGAIQVSALRGPVRVTSGSGAVAADEIAGSLVVTTSSSGFTGRSLRSDVHVRTSSGAVVATLAGNGSVDVETGSSSIRLSGLRAGVSATTRSGRVSLEGRPGAPWHTTTGSGSIDVDIDAASGFALDATTGSGSVTLTGASLTGSASKRRVAGTVGAGGPLVHVTTRSGSIRVQSR